MIARDVKLVQYTLKRLSWQSVFTIYTTTDNIKYLKFEETLDLFNLNQ